MFVWGTCEGRFVDWLLDSSLVLGKMTRYNVLSDAFLFLGYGTPYPWVKIHGTGPKT